MFPTFKAAGFFSPSPVNHKVGHTILETVPDTAYLVNDTPVPCSGKNKDLVQKPHDVHRAKPCSPFDVQEF